MHGITAQCQPGEVLALMGPSGSSKTSVLSVIGGRTPESVRLEGTVAYNGQKLTKVIKKRIGYVLQDDMLFSTLTVYETLYYAAFLRLSSKMHSTEKVKRVEAVIFTLGLSRCKDTIVGGGLRRGVSGGERKRVSIGHELLINPAAIFLDEPTSGLDSTTAMNLLTTLRGLASGGRAVITTIHQPSSRLYMQLDKLLLLSEGHMMYYGQARLAADWFDKLGYMLPRGVNQAEFFLDLASGEISTRKVNGEEARLHCIACAEKFLAENLEGFTNGNELCEANFGEELWNAAESQKIIKPSGGSPARTSGLEKDVQNKNNFFVDPTLTQNSKDDEQASNSIQNFEDSGASWIGQYCILLERAIKVRRFEALALQDLSQCLAIAILAGLFYFQVGQTDTIYGAQNANGIVFYTTLFLSIRNMLGALFVFPPEYRMIVKERASGMYQVSAYYLARTSSDLPIDCTLPIIFITIIYWMGGLNFSAKDFIATVCAVILVVLVAQSFGLLVGAIVPDLKSAETLSRVIVMTFLLVAGFFITNIPVWIGWLKYGSFVYYSYTLITKIQYKGRDFYFCGTSNVKRANSAPPGSCILVPNGHGVQKELRLSRNPNEAPWEAAILVGYLILIRCLVYLALRIKTQSKIR